MGKVIEPMTSGPIWKRMTYFALPIMLGNLFQQLYMIADSLIVGQFLGSSALAAVSSSDSLIFMLIGFLMGLSAGAGVIVARFFGAEDHENLHAAVHTTVAMGLFAGVVMTLVGVAFSPLILRLMGTPASVMPEAVTYMRFYFSGSMGFVMYNIFVGILQAVGDSRHPLYYLIASSVINVILDLLFIGVFHMGVEGAAIATVLSQLLSAGMCLIQLLKTKGPYRVRLRDVRFERSTLRQIIRIGLPSGVQNSIIAFANLVVQSNVNAFGEMAMAGCGAYSKVEGLGFLPINSFTLAISTFVGQNLGAGDYERTRKGARFGILIAVILAELIGVVIFIFAPIIIAAFDDTPEVIRFGVEKARTGTLFYCLLAFSHSVSAVLRGAGKAVVPMFVMLSFWCVVRVTFLTIMVPLTGSILTVYWVYPLTWFLSSVFFLWYYKKVNWMDVASDKIK